MMEGYPRANAELSRTEKIDFLSERMYGHQPDFPDFRGHKSEGFSRGRLDSAEKRLNRKLESITQREMEMGGAPKDEFAEGAEPLLTYVLNEGRLFPSRDCYSYLASDYDDKMNGTDIVLHVSGRQTGELETFSLDVATGTDPKNIQKKFEESGKKHGQTPEWAADVEYCKHGEKRWSAPGAPHFVIGMQPAQINAALGGIVIKPGEIVAREEDKATDFKLLSEIYEQVKMQLTLPVNREINEAAEARRAILKDLGSATLTGLYKVLKIDQFPPEKRKTRFDEFYPMAMDSMKVGDETYRHIIDETKKLQHRPRGKKTARSATRDY